MQLEGGINVQKIGPNRYLVNGVTFESQSYARTQFEFKMEYYETLNYIARNGRLWNT